MTFHNRTMEAAKGKWKGILQEFGVPESYLHNRHGPCPLCGGSDRFRWDNESGRGTYICGQCGAGDGMRLAMEYTGKEWKVVANLIDGMVGNLKPEAPKPDMTPEKRREILRDTYKATQAVEPGDLVHRYLESRGVGELIYPKALRFAPKLRDGDGGIRPAMVAMIGVPGEEKPASMHKTFLKSDGSGKAEMPNARRIMPGSLPEGACVMLSEYTPGGPIGIAEGIETALSASALYDVPVWAAINSTMLAKWFPPEGCDEVVIFGDNDAKFGGQSAAYRLAHRLSVKGFRVSVHIPDAVGEDWNDVLMRRAGIY